MSIQIIVLGSKSLVATREETAARYKTLPAAFIKSLKRGREELFANSDIEEILRILPVVPKGKFIGNMSANMCHLNALTQRAKKGKSVFLGYGVAMPTSLFSHSFNVVDGLVEEHTKMKNFELYTYIGVPAPEGVEKPTPAYLKKLSNLTWVKKQLALM